MHPILGDRLRLRLHLLAWSLAGALIALLVHLLLGAAPADAALFGIPLGLVAAPVSLSAWYVCRALPLQKTGAVRIGITAAGAAIVTASLWAGAGRLWWQVLRRAGLGLPDISMTALFTLLVGLGGIGYLLAVTVHYVLQASEQSAIAERRALESQVAQREAELRALRAQVDPHFLFNSLNSVVGLMSADVAQARAMCLGLAEFLRDSLTLGAEAHIPLAREVALAEQYLRVERVRFGSRLSVETSVEAEAATVRVPPLILQPLVENAVRHGVATMLEGGAVRVRAVRRGPVAVVEVANPFDPDARRRGTGFGMDIVRRRLAATFGERAVMTAVSDAGAYRVSITIPAEAPAAVDDSEVEEEPA